MKKEKFLKTCSLLGIPALVAVLGLLLVLSPDSATALAARLIGWVLVAGGAAKAISMAVKFTAPSLSGWIFSLAGIALGTLVLSNPLILAESIGRFAGILLAIRAISDLRHSNYNQGKALALVTLIIGIVLFVMPMTLTRTLLRLAGIVVVIISAFNIIEKLRELKQLDSGEKPRIVDADE